MRSSTLFFAVRGPFLPASAMPVIVGSILAWGEDGVFHPFLFALSLVAVLFIHAGANALNDYFDHRSGTDDRNRSFIPSITGGARLIQEGRISAETVKGTGTAFLLAGCALGLLLVALRGVPLLLIGLFGAASAWAYTAPPFRLAYRGLGEAVVALDFGVLPFLGACYVQTGRFPRAALLCSLPVASLIAAVLLINEFPDFEADSSAGKRNLVVLLGRRGALPLYAFLSLVFPFLLWPILTGFRVSLPLAALPLAVAANAIAWRHPLDPVRIRPANRQTLLLHLLFCLLLAAALLIP